MSSTTIPRPQLSRLVSYGGLALPPEIVTAVLEMALVNIESTSAYSQMLLQPKTELLLAGSLVSRCWSRQAQRLLHRDVVLSSDAQARKWLEQSKHFPSRSLTIYGADPKVQLAAVEESTAAEIMSALRPSVQHLSLHGFGDKIPSLLHSANLAYLHSLECKPSIGSVGGQSFLSSTIPRSLRTLSIEGNDQLVELLVAYLLASAASLKTLTLQGAASPSVLAAVSACTGLKTLICRSTVPTSDLDDLLRVSLGITRLVVHLGGLTETRSRLEAVLHRLDDLTHLRQVTIVGHLMMRDGGRAILRQSLTVEQILGRRCKERGILLAFEVGRA